MATIEELLDPQDEELGNVESPENVEGPENVQGPENVEGPGNVEGLGNVEGPVTDLVKKRSSIAEVEKTSTYTIRPKFEKKFRPGVVKEIIHQTLREVLSEKDYSGEEVKNWTKEISDNLQERLKELQLDRYKYVVQVVIGEQRGEGVRMGCRCFWDSDTDNYAQDIFMNDSLFCVAAAYGIYYY